MKIQGIIDKFKGLSLLQAENKGRIAAFLQLVIIAVFLYHLLRREIVK